MTRKGPRILIIDDDEFLCRTLSAILQPQGYHITIARTAKEAIEKTRSIYYNLALIDIRLPDMEGTKLLAKLQEITPGTMKIVVTGYPSMQNAVAALNLGADSYIVKPIAPTELLKVIANKLEAQRRTTKMTGDTLVEWVRSQVAKQTSNFQEFLQENADELAAYDLTKTQAKIYITLTALGVASASEIANLSEIRREEVYRVLPILEKRGLVIRKLRTPMRFSATPPDKCIELLTKTKLKIMKEEIDRLREKQSRLILKLKAVELPVQQESRSTEVILNKDSTLMRLIEMTQNAKHQIDVVTSLEELKIAYINRSKTLTEKLMKTVKIRAITETQKLDTLTENIIKTSKAFNNPIELRQVQEPPFNLIIVDGNEAMWGEFKPKDEDATTYLWTSDPVQIGILGTSFEKLWKDSSSL